MRQHKTKHNGFQLFGFYSNKTAAEVQGELVTYVHENNDDMKCYAEKCIQPKDS